MAKNSCGIKLHPRYSIASAGRRDLEEAMWEVIKKRDLTYVEALQALSCCSDVLLKFMLRHERHPDDKTGEKKGDEA